MDKNEGNLEVVMDSLKLVNNAFARCRMLLLAAPFLLSSLVLSSEKGYGQIMDQLQQLRLEAVSQLRGIAAAKAQDRPDLPELESQYQVTLEKIQNLRLEALHSSIESEAIAVESRYVASHQMGDAAPKRESTPRTQKIYKWRPEVEKRAGFSGVEFLWWTVREGALDYIVKGQVSSINLAGTVDGNQSIGAVGDLKSPKYDWEPGLRARVGYRFPRDFWELEALYTYFHSSTSETLGPPTGFDILIPNGANPPVPQRALAATFFSVTTTPMNQATASMHFNYNVADLILARRFLETKYIISKQFISFTGAWIWQDWRFAYFGGPSTQTPGEIGSTTNGEENWKFSGGGLRTGVNTDWFLGKGLSIESKGSISGYLGHYHHHSSLFWGNQAEAPSAPQYGKNVLFNDTRLVFNAQFALLPKWGMMFNSWGFELYAGYELNLWFNLHEVYKTIGASPVSFLGREMALNRGLVGLHGLTAGAKFTF